MKGYAWYSSTQMFNFVSNAHGKTVDGFRISVPSAAEALDQALKTVRKGKFQVGWPEAPREVTREQILDEIEQTGSCHVHVGANCWVEIQTMERLVQGHNALVSNMSRRAQDEADRSRKSATAGSGGGIRIVAHPNRPEDLEVYDPAAEVLKA